MHLGSPMLPEHSFPVRRKTSVGLRDDRRGLLSPSGRCTEMIKEAALQSTEPRWGWGFEDLLKVRALSASSEEQGQRAIRALKALNDARLKGGPFQDQASALHEALRPMAFGQAFEHGLLSRLCPAAEFLKVPQDTTLELYGQCDALYVVLSGSVKVARAPVLVSRMLCILVKSATGLLGDSEQDRLDPYVKVQVGNHVQQTPAMNDAGADPEWNYTIRLPYNNEPRIEFNVMEEDDYSRDDLLGTAYLDAFMFVRDGWEGELTLGLGLPDRNRAAAAPPQGSQIGRNVRNSSDGPKASDGAGRLSVKLSFDFDPTSDGRNSQTASRKASGEDSPSAKTRLASTAPLSSAIFSAAASGISPPGTPLGGSRANTDSPPSPMRGRAKSVFLPNGSVPNSASGLGLDATLDRSMSMVPSGSRQSGKTETTKRLDLEMTGDSTQFAATAPLKPPEEEEASAAARVLLPGHFFGYDAGGGALETLQTTEFAVFPRSILNIASEAFLKEKKEEKSNFLKEFFPGLKEIDPTAFDNFVGAFQYQTLPAGHTLVQAGECPGKNSSRVLLLKRGTCQEFIPTVRSTVISKPLTKMKDIYKPSPPATLSVGVLGPGAVVGFASALFGLVEPFTVVAQDTVTVLELHSSLRVPWPKAVVPRLAELLKARTDFHLQRWRHLQSIPTAIPLDETPYKPHQWKVSDAPFWRNKSLNPWRVTCITDLYDAVGWTPPAVAATSSSSANMASPSLLPTGGASSPASSPPNSRPGTSPMTFQGQPHPQLQPQLQLQPHQTHIQAPPPLPLSPLAKRSNSHPSSPFGMHVSNSPATFTGGSVTPPSTAPCGTGPAGFAGSFGGTFGAMVGDKSNGLATASTTAGSFCPRTSTPPTPPCRTRPPVGVRIPECRSEPQLSRPASSSSSATVVGARGSTPPSAAMHNSASALAKRKGHQENVYNVNSGLGRCNTPWGVWSPSGLLDPPSQKLRPSGVVLQKVRERRKKLSQSRSSIRPTSRGLAGSAGADAEIVEREKQDHPPVNFHVAKDWQRMRQVASSQALEKMYRRQARASSIARLIS